MSQLKQAIVVTCLVHALLCAAGNTSARGEDAFEALFQNEAPENSRELRVLWESKRMLDEILSMDSPRDWAGLEPGAVTVTPDCVEGKGALQIPIDLEPGKYLRFENNFLSGHRDGFRNMMCMGIEAEDLSWCRSLQFSYRSDLQGDCALLFRIYDRTGGWLDWTVARPVASHEWKTVTLAMPARAGDLVDLKRIGGVMFEARAGNGQVGGTLCFDGISFSDECRPGIPADTHALPDMSYAAQPYALGITDAHATRPAEFVLNMSALELPIWDNDREATMRCLEEELQRFKSLSHLALFINPGTRKRVHEDPQYLPRLQELLCCIATYCEEHSIPFYQMVGVEGFGLYPPPLMFAVEQAAPRMCRGFLFGECSIETNSHVDYLIALMEYLAPKKKKVLYFQQSSYWMGVMQHSEGEPARFIQALRDPRYKDVFVPMWENLLPCAQGLCFATTMGFWRGGLTADWGVSAQSWAYANLNLGGTADMPAHWWLRMFLTVVTTGGRFVEIEPLWPFDGENTEGQVRHSKQWAHNTRWIGDTRGQLACDLEPGEELRALRYFDRLLSAGIVRAPARPELLRSLPDLTLKVIEPDVESTTRYKWGIFRRALEESWWNLGDCPNAWEMALQTRKTDVFRTLYNSSHIYDQTVPETPWGLVTIVPPGSALPASTRILECDSSRLYRENQWLGLDESHRVVVEAYQDAACALPFQAEGCFLSAVEAGPGAYLVYLIDPEERFPVGVSTRLKLNLSKAVRCIDALTRETVNIEKDVVPVEIPPAGFRVFYLNMP